MNRKICALPDSDLDDRLMLAKYLLIDVQKRIVKEYVAFLEPEVRSILRMKFTAMQVVLAEDQRTGSNSHVPAFQNGA